MEKLKQYLNAFCALKNEEWEVLKKHLKLIELPMNTHFLNAGEICENLCFVESGILRTYIIDKNEKEKTAFFHFENEFLTDLDSFLNKTPSNYFIQSLTDVRLYTIPNDIRAQIHEESPIFNKIGRMIAEWHCLKSRKRIEDFIFLTPEERYLKLVNNSPDIFQKISLGYIAEYINIRPQSLSRIRKRVSH